MSDDNNQSSDTMSRIKLAIIKDLGLENADPEMQDEVLAKMGQVVLEKIFIETIERLDDSGRDQFKQMLDEKKDPEQVEIFLKDKISDYDKMVEKIVVELKEDMKKAGQMEI